MNPAGTQRLPDLFVGNEREEVRSRFEFTQGLDPIFRTVDGFNCSSAL